MRYCLWDPEYDATPLIKSKQPWRQSVQRLNGEYDGSITLCSQKHEEDQLQLECRTPILKEWTISNMLMLLQMVQVLVPRLEDNYVRYA